jgi:hypothetical protein
MEVWKDIPNYDNYEISNLANVRNKKTKYLFQSKSPKQRYIQISLSKNNKIKSYALHRLVAEVFVPNPENKLYVNHIDGNKRNNNADNLEWVTQTENMNHASSTGLTSNTNSQCEELELLDISGNIIKIFRNQYEASNFLNVTQSAICLLLSKKTTGNRKFKKIYMKKDENLVKIFNSNKEIAEHFDIHCSTVCEILKGKISPNKTKDYIFEIIYDIPIIRKKEQVIEIYNEIWKDIPYSKNHIISNMGRLYNKSTKKYVKGSNDGRYMRISFERNKSNYAIHRLVAEVFVENPENKPYVNHKDSDTYNNNVSNLEWVTQSENMIHSLNSGFNPFALKIIQYDINGKEIRKWNSLNQIEKELNICHGTISVYCNKKQLVNNEFIFRFENQPLNINELSEYMKDRKIIHKDGRIKITQYDKNNKKLKDWNSISDASRALSIDASDIGRCCKNKKKTCGGYIWKYQL